MESDQPSSDDLIKKAKESLLNVAEERDVEVQSRVEDIERAPVPSRPVDQHAPQRQVRRPLPPAKATRPVRDPAAGRRVSKSAERTPAPAPTDVGAGRSRSGMVLRIVGSAILLMVAGLWLLLLIGIIDDQSEVGETLGGGVLLTLVPLAIGLLFRRAGIRRGTRA